MIRVDTSGLDQVMSGLPIFAKESGKLDDESLARPTVKHVDPDTGIELLVPGFESKRFKSHWSKINKTLLTKQHGKCAYCESMMAAVSHSDVEHFRPKAGFDPATGGTYSANLAGIRGGLVRSGYFWLAYKAENYYVSCAICNQVYKKNRFDVLPDSPRPTTKNRNAPEKPMFVDPGREDPRKYIRFDPYTALAVPATLWEEYLKQKGALDPLGLVRPPRSAPLQDVEKEMKERLVRLGDVWTFLNFSRRHPKVSDTFKACPPPDKLTAEAEKVARDRLTVSSGTGGTTMDPEPTKLPTSVTLTVERQLENEIANYYSVFDYNDKAFKEALWQAAPLYVIQRDQNKLAEIEKNVRSTNPVGDMVQAEDVEELVKNARAKHITDQQLAVYEAARRELAAQRKLHVEAFTREKVAKDVGVSRALYTIVNLGLNRRELLRRRALHLARLRALVLFLKLAKNWNGVNFIAEVLKSEGQAPPPKTSQAADEIEAAIDTLRLAVSPRGEYTSLSVDALRVWSFELLELLKLAQTNQNTVSVRIDPWLFRYYDIAMRPLLAEEVADDEDEEEDEIGAASADDPTLAPLTNPADAVYFVVLQRFGVTYTKIASRYRLKAAEMNVVTKAVALASSTANPKIESEYYAEILRLLLFYASRASIIDNCCIPAFARAQKDVEYWASVDADLVKLEKTYGGKDLQGAAAKAKSACTRLTTDALFEWWWAGQTPARKKKTKKGLRPEFEKAIA